MRSFLRMINYLNRYSALSAHLAAPLSTLTHQATDYKPGRVYQENFNQLKMEISNMKVLPYFDVNAETTVQIDASKKGLGACLIQKDTFSRVTPMDPEDNIQLPIRTANMITTHILMSVQPQEFFQEVRLTEEEYSIRQSTHKTQLLHQHRISV